VCGRVGVCLLEYGEYSGVIEENFSDQRYLIVKRPEGGGFRVNGANKEHHSVIPLNRFPTRIFE
jgi:hypothetical protein